MSKTILAIDIGTTAVKLSVFAKDLTMLCYSSEEYQLITESGDIVELEADKYWRAVRSGVLRLMKNESVSMAQVSVIAVTTQGETLIPVDEKGNPLGNAVVWLDGRAAEEAEEINKYFGADRFFVVTGIPECNGYCPVSKLVWFKRNRKEVYDKTYKFLMVEDYIIMKLTGRFVTEKSLASTSGYFDIVNDCLWSEMLQYTGIDESKLPEFLECGKIVSEILPAVAGELGLSNSTVVVTAAMDQVCGAVGAGNVEPGMVTETTGTAMCVGATSNNFDANGEYRIPVYRHMVKGKYLAVAVCMTAGIVLKWFKDVFCSEEVQTARLRGVPVYKVLDEMAENAPETSNGLMLLPYFSGMMQPYSCPRARGVFWGVGLETTKNDFVRSVFEGVAYMLKENIELIENMMNIKIAEVRSLGGGSKSNIWCSIKADVTGRDIILMDEPECTLLGAAVLAGAAVGLFPDIESAVDKANSIKYKVSCNKIKNREYEKAYQKYKQLLEANMELY